MSTERITDGEVWVRSVEKRLHTLENRDLRGVGPTPLFLPTYNGWAYGPTTTTYSGSAQEYFAQFAATEFSDVEVDGATLTPGRTGFWLFGMRGSVSVPLSGRTFIDVVVTTTEMGLKRHRFGLPGNNETVFALSTIFRIGDLGNDIVNLKYYQDTTTGSVTWEGEWYLRWLGGN